MPWKKLNIKTVYSLFNLQYFFNPLKMQLFIRDILLGVVLVTVAVSCVYGNNFDDFEVQDYNGNNLERDQCKYLKSFDF
jgi:hypothetical protein